MSVKIKTGTLSDFFKSAKETAREIDRGKRLTPKNTVWVEQSDFIKFMKPEKAELVRYLRGKRRIIYRDLVADMCRTSASVSRDLKLLHKYQLIRIIDEKTSGHGICKIIEPLFGEQMLEFKLEI